MPTPFSGGCLCGAIRYECSTEPIMVANCHCRDCQRASGSAFATNLVVPVESVSLSKASPTYHDTLADRGHTMSRGFCPTCGARLMLKNSAYPDILVIHASSLADPSWVRVGMDIYTASAQPWDFLDPLRRHFTHMPERKTA
ncbi:MAG: GFA family protein [Desulfurellaceae bacterium]|nr:GFA family protein [Desulfurellaceae bacterium]